MPPKAADKKPASKAPATASKAPEKKDAGKKTAPSGDKKKRTKARKETYSSYIYKGEFPNFLAHSGRAKSRRDAYFAALHHYPPQVANTRCSPEAGPPRHGYLQPGHVHPQLFRQR
jgi:histone H2B